MFPLTNLQVTSPYPAHIYSEGVCFAKNYNVGVVPCVHETIQNG